LLAAGNTVYQTPHLSDRPDHLASCHKWCKVFDLGATYTIAICNHF
jgi:hypothetical protein